jgi:hypothetical protein
MAVQVGDRGTAMTPLRPQGSVRIAGDRHDARSERGYIEAGAEIVVIRGDNMGLVVRQVEVGETTDLPSHGLPAYRSFGERVAAEGARDEAERAQWESARWRYGLAIGGLLGAIAAGVGVALLWEQIGVHSITPGAIAAAAVAGGAVWGVCVFRGLDSALRVWEETTGALRQPQLGSVWRAGPLR